MDREREESSLLGSCNVHTELWTHGGHLWLSSVPEEAELGLLVLLSSVWTGCATFPSPQGGETFAELVGLLMKGQARKLMRKIRMGRLSGGKRSSTVWCWYFLRLRPFPFI